MVPIMLCEIWQWTPLMFLMVLTGLMSLPQNQIRAAIALGACPARIFREIMLPLLTPVMGIAVLIRSIETFKIFRSGLHPNARATGRRDRNDLDVYV